MYICVCVHTRLYTDARTAQCTRPSRNTNSLLRCIIRSHSETRAAHMHNLSRVDTLEHPTACRRSNLVLSQCFAPAAPRDPPPPRPRARQRPCSAAAVAPPHQARGVGRCPSEASRGYSRSRAQPGSPSPGKNGKRKERGAKHAEDAERRGKSTRCSPLRVPTAVSFYVTTTHHGPFTFA